MAYFVTKFAQNVSYFGKIASSLQYFHGIFFIKFTIFQLGMRSADPVKWLPRSIPPLVSGIFASWKYTDLIVKFYQLPE